ncbi:MAG: ParA family protein [Clostridiales bacterium]|jgi:chromosome partitioning protein|nr:ParA family protein [Clostridiales bacterium]
MKIIAVANQTGGVGKTTTTAHLAWGLAKKGKRVLVVDFDPQGNLSSGMGALTGAEQATVLEWLGLGASPAEFSATVRHSSGVDILPANIYLDSGELLLYRQLGRERCLDKRLKPLRGRYDYVLIDCRPSLGLLTINALTAADEVLVPMRADFYSIPAVEQLIVSIKEIRENCNPRLKYNGFLITMLDKRRNTEDYIANFADLAESVKTKLYSAQIRLNAAAADVPSYSMSLYEYKPTSNAAADYAAFTEEFLQREESGNA